MTRWGRLRLRALWILSAIGRALGVTRTRVHGAPIFGKPACEACERNEATESRWSELEGRSVFFCEWCARRFEKVNKRAGEARAVPRTRRPKKGGPRGGRAA